jgi:hypothetical protein
VHSNQEKRAYDVDALEVKEYGDSPSSGGDELIMLDSLA